MFKSLCKFIKNDIKTIFLIVVVVFAIIMLVADINGVESIQNIRSSHWSQVISKYIAFGAFVFSVAIWTTTLFKEWRDSLPKRLSVYFILDDHCLMYCNYAYLSGEADIRQTAQQIGAQIADLRFLNFNIANVHSKELKRIYSKKEVNKHADAEILGYPFRHYCAVIQLNSPPATLDKKHTYIWLPPFNINLEKQDSEKLAESELAKDKHIQEKIAGDAPRVVRLSYNFKEKRIRMGGESVEMFYNRVSNNKGSLK